MSKHTPGIWKVSKDKVTVFNDISDDPCRNFIICAPTAHSYFKQEEKEANAKLIASAPDLLEACKIAYEYLSQTCYEDKEHWKEIENAINKATL